MTIQEIKKIGKVKKLFKGTYLYEGVNFSVEFDNDFGYWAIDEYSIGKDVKIEFSQYSRKKDLVWGLKCIDASII